MTDRADTGAETERRRLNDVANAAALTAAATENAGTENAEEGTATVWTPYGKAVVHLERDGADVELPEGATVHIRFS